MALIKKRISMFLNFAAILLISISISSVTSNGIVEAMATFYETISFTSKPFHMTNAMYQNGIRLSCLPLNILFFVGLAFLIFSSIKYYKKSKWKGVILTAVDIIFSAIVFLMFLWKNYLLMVSLVITMFTLNLILQATDENKLNQAIVISTSVSLWLICMCFLIKQFTLMIRVVDVTGLILDELINVSRINAICLFLFIVPCTISLLSSISQSKENNHAR